MEKKNNKPVLNNEDIFAQAFDEYSSSNLAKRLNEKFRIKPYYEKFKALKNSSLITSYLFNTVSALAASSLVFFFMRQFVAARFDNFIANIIAVLVTLVFIFMMEWKKREVLSKFFTDLYQLKKFRAGLVAILFLIFGISISFSYYGGKWAIVELTPEPELIQKDSLENDLESKIVVLNSQIANAENTKWRGTTTTSAMRAKETLVKEKLLLTGRLFSIQEQEENENGTILMEHFESRGEKIAGLLESLVRP